MMRLEKKSFTDDGRKHSLMSWMRKRRRLVSEVRTGKYMQSRGDYFVLEHITSRWVFYTN